MVLTLQDIKDHLKIDGDEQNSELKRLYDAAEDYVLKYLDRPSLPWDSNPCPASIKQALLLVIGDLNENREAAVTGTIHTDNPTVFRLLNFYRDQLGV